MDAWKRVRHFLPRWPVGPDPIRPISVAAAIQKIINHNWVIRSFEKVENDGDIRYLNRLISILALEIWYRLFITKEISSSKKL